MPCGESFFIDDLCSCVADLNCSESRPFLDLQIIGPKNGAHHAKLVELRPLTVFEDYKIQWRQAKTNLSELVRLRWIQKLSVAHIADLLDRSPETIQMYICRMRKPGGLAQLDLNPSELSLVKKQINTVFQGK